VTAVADDQRGERLVALYVQPGTTPADLWQRLSDTELPRLWLPKRENIYQVDDLPLLGTGKLDLRAVKVRAQALVSVEAASSQQAG
jgi:acyl-[acyl-carrier-protein]-phospholipid O-acyltransferase/long-chain-fatty-acid--[acyl-carrier-protein] ligase